MALTTVLSVSVRPERFGSYETAVQRLAAKAQEDKEPFEWAAHQVTAGALGTIHFVSEAPDWATLGTREPVDVLIRRVMGDSEGSELIDQIYCCMAAERYIIGQPRLDLSCPPEGARSFSPMSMVTLIRSRPGGQDACEELIRKVAQAIPAVEDPRRFVAYQTVIGDLRRYWVVTPLDDIGLLDRSLQPAELLQKAFGAEGALLYRTGIDAIEHLERQFTALRPDLSNGAWVSAALARQRATAQPAEHVH